MLLRIYDYFKTHKKALWSSLAVLTAAFATLAFSLHYSENIRDFLPLGTHEGEALDVYQNISGADRILILFENGDPDEAVEAMDLFISEVEAADNEGLCSSLSSGLDRQDILRVTDFTYANMPYFLCEEDYARIDSLLALPGYIGDKLRQNRLSLAMFSGDMLSASIRRDPLGLFSPVMNRLLSSAPAMGFQTVDGYIFTPDMSRGILMMTSPFGGSETEGNGKIVKTLNRASKRVMREYPEIGIHLTGAPVIAVGNASQIKRDSVLAISLSIVLIVILLAFSFHSVLNILLIFLSIGWGWLFALGGLALFKDNVSLIVIGISSVILGIAVNYPLHLVSHTRHQKNMRTTLKEISMPLLVGNITTIGAFLALIPLSSVALRDLGLFASLLLAGTILFVLIYLPHFIRNENPKEKNIGFLDAPAAFNPHTYKGVFWAVAALTLVLGCFSFRNSFNSNMSDINYMTAEQRADMQYFQSLAEGERGNETVNLYVLSPGKDFDDALTENESILNTIDTLERAGFVLKHKGVGPFLASKSVQAERLQNWRRFAARFREKHLKEFESEAALCGFAPGAFQSFKTLIEPNRLWEPEDASGFEALSRTVLSSGLTSLESTGQSYIVDVLTVEAPNKDEVSSRFEHCFDMADINNALSNRLSDNFNYIGWACSLIVFFFLWLSFGRLELALLSFLPMAVSWIWILGIMAVFGIRFNIVNVILATFIFGQGDDYTIFMTEGCQYEYTHRRPILASYKSAITKSALIMFFGIGTLITAKHPAMRSLGEVTVIGMASVVFMAYLIPPFLFACLTTKNGKTRRHPLTLRTLLAGEPKDLRKQVYGRYIYKGSGLCHRVKRSLKNNGLGIMNTASADGVIRITDKGYGELAILAALSHPEAEVIAEIPDEEKRNIAMVAACDFVSNITFKA